MHFTQYKKGKYCYFEIQNTNEDFFNTFMEIMQKSYFSIKIEERKEYQKIPNDIQEEEIEEILNSELLLFVRLSGVECFWCYKEGITTIVTYHGHELLVKTLLEDFCKLYMQFLNGDLSLEDEEEKDYEDDEDYYDFDDEENEELEEEDEEIEYNKSDEEDLREDGTESPPLAFNSFSSLNALQENWAKMGINLEDFQALARQMSEQYEHTQEELEKIGKLSPQNKALRMRSSLLQQKAFRKVCNLNLAQFEHLSAKDLKEYQNYIDTELLRVVKALTMHEYATQDNISVIAFHPPTEQITAQKIQKETQKEKSLLNQAKTYLLNLVTAGAKVDNALVNLAMQSVTTYTSLSYQRIEKQVQIQDKEAYVYALPRHKMLENLNLILQTCVYQNYQRVNGLTQIKEEIEQEWSNEKHIEMFVIKLGGEYPKLIAYKQLDSKFRQQELKKIAQKLLENAMREANGELEKSQTKKLEFITWQIEELKFKQPQPTAPNPKNAYKKAMEIFTQTDKDKTPNNTESKNISLSPQPDFADSNNADSSGKPLIFFVHLQDSEPLKSAKPTRLVDSLKDYEKEAIQKIFNFRSDTQISQIHLNALDELFNSIIKNLCGFYEIAADLLSKEQQQALLESKEFQALFDDAIDERIFENTFIHSLFHQSEVFSTKNCTTLYDLLGVPFELTWEHFLLLLCTGVKIKKSYIKHLKNAKNIYKTMYCELVNLYNENFLAFKHATYTTKNGEKIALNNLRALQNERDFLKSSNNYQLLKRVLKILKELQSVEQRAMYLEGYPSYAKFQECEDYRPELFIYAFIDDKFNFLAYESLEKKEQIEGHIDEIMQDLKMGNLHTDIEPIVEFLRLSSSVYLSKSSVDNTTFSIESTKTRLKINLKDFSNTKNCKKARKAFLDFLERSNIYQLIFTKKPKTANKLLSKLGDPRHADVSYLDGERIDDIPYNIIAFKLYDTHRDGVAIINAKDDGALEFLIGILREQDKANQKMPYQLIVGDIESQKVDGALWFYKCFCKGQEFIDDKHYQYFIGDEKAFCEDFLENKNFFDLSKYSQIYLGYCEENSEIAEITELEESPFNDEIFIEYEQDFCNIYTKQEDSTLAILINSSGYYESKFPKFLYEFLESKSNATFSPLTFSHLLNNKNYKFFRLQKELDLQTPKITQGQAKLIIQQEDLIHTTWYEFGKEDHVGEDSFGIWFNNQNKKYEVFETGERAWPMYFSAFDTEEEAILQLLRDNYEEKFYQSQEYKENKSGFTREKAQEIIANEGLEVIWYDEALKPHSFGIKHDKQNNTYACFATDSKAEIIGYKTLDFKRENVALYALINRARLKGVLVYPKEIGERLVIKNADDLLFKAIMTNDFELFTQAIKQGANISGMANERQGFSEYAREDIICEEGAYYYGLALSQVLGGITLNNEEFDEEELLKENEQAFKILYAMRDLKPSDEAKEYAKVVLNDTHADWWYDTYKWADDCGYEGDLEDEEAIFAWLRENKGLRYFETLIKELGFDLELKWE